MPSFESEAAFSGYCNAGHQPLTIQQLTLLLWPQLQAADTAPAPPTRLASQDKKRDIFRMILRVSFIH